MTSGFSLVEMTIAMALTLALAASIFTLAQASRGSVTTQSEIADQQQRARAGVDALARDLMNAGAGSYVGVNPGPLNASLPAVLPFRRTVAGGDPPGTFRSDTITAMFVPATAAQTTLTADMATGSATMQVARVATCDPALNLCGFVPGTTILAFDDAGGSQLFTVGSVFDGARLLETTTAASSTFKTGATIVAAEVHVYSTKTDPATRITQLVHGDAGAGGDSPVLDHVVALTFDYGIAPAALVDGPWRPNASSVERWDEDLLRVRTVGVTIRVESAIDALRGPAGALFARGGTATDPRTWVPDLEVRFTVSPRNLGLRR